MSYYFYILIVANQPMIFIPALRALRYRYQAAQSPRQEAWNRCAVSASDLLVHVRGAVLRAPVGIVGVVRDDARADESDRRIERLGPVAGAGVERDQRLADRPRVRLERQHQGSRNAFAAGGRMHDPFGDLAAMRLIGPQRDVHLHSADDNVIEAGDEEHARPARDVGKHLLDPEAPAVIERIGLHEADRSAAVDAIRDDLGEARLHGVEVLRRDDVDADVVHGDLYAKTIR